MIRDAKFTGKPVCVQDYMDGMPFYFIDKKGRLEQPTFSSTENKAAIGIQSGHRAHMAQKSRKLKQLERECAIKLQRQCRRHLIQKEITPILQQQRQRMKVAIYRNLLISVPGTQQGKTGWYTSPKQKGYHTSTISQTALLQSFGTQSSPIPQTRVSIPSSVQRENGELAESSFTFQRHFPYSLQYLDPPFLPCPFPQENHRWAH
jgi:hypothetical protein